MAKTYRLITKSNREIAVDHVEHVKHTSEKVTLYGDDSDILMMYPQDDVHSLIPEKDEKKDEVKDEIENEAKDEIKNEITDENGGSKKENKDGADKNYNQNYNQNETPADGPAVHEQTGTVKTEGVDALKSDKPEPRKPKRRTKNTSRHNQHTKRAANHRPVKNYGQQFVYTGFTHIQTPINITYDTVHDVYWAPKNECILTSPNTDNLSKHVLTKRNNILTRHSKPYNDKARKLIKAVKFDTMTEAMDALTGQIISRNKLEPFSPSPLFEHKMIRVSLIYGEHRFKGFHDTQSDNIIIPKGEKIMRTTGKSVNNNRPDIARMRVYMLHHQSVPYNHEMATLTEDTVCRNPLYAASILTGVKSERRDWVIDTKNGPGRRTL